MGRWGSLPQDLSARIHSVEPILRARAAPSGGSEGSSCFSAVLFGGTDSAYPSSNRRNSRLNQLSLGGLPSLSSQSYRSSQSSGVPASWNAMFPRLLHPNKLPPVITLDLVFIVFLLHLMALGFVIHPSCISCSCEIRS